MAASASCRLARCLASDGLARRSIASEVAGSRPRLIMAPRVRPGKGGDARISKQMPWIFRDQVTNADELRSKTPGTALLVDVENSQGKELGIAMCNLAKGGATNVNIFARMLSDNVAVNVDADFFKAKISRALEHRQRCGLEDGRLINAEGDFLPGVLCDRYHDVLCLQFTALAAEELMREEILDALEAVISPRAIVLRYDAQQDRMLEQASIKRPEVARGAEPGLLECKTTSGFVFTADPLKQGWTTGSFFAERRVRLLLDEFFAEGPPAVSSVAGTPRKGRQPAGPPAQPQVLSLFGESSGIYAAWKGAKVTCALMEGGNASDGRSAMELLAARNHCMDTIKYTTLGEEPRFDELGSEFKGHFDVVLLEPPALAPTYGKVEEGARLYTAWVSLAAMACRPGGLLLMSCRSRTMSAVRLLRCINLGIWSAGLRGRLVHRSSHAGLDSPIHFALQDTNQFQLLGIRLSQPGAQ